LHEGQRGLCYVRGRQNNEVVLHSYGRSSGFCVDPIEKKPFNHFYPGTSVLSFGTAGCNLACKFCQNWDMSKSREMDTLADSAMPEELAKAAVKLGCKSVAYTYNDPVIFLEYAVDTAIACREHGVNSVAVTAGYTCDQPRQDFFNHMDAVNVDLKAFSNRFYKHLCGAELDAVLDTLIYIHQETNCWMEVTTLLIPGQNDSDSELDKMTDWLVNHLGESVPLHFSAFHPDWKMRDTPATPPSTLTRARNIAINKGLKYVYTGNVHDTAGSSTYCPSCGQRVIERDWYTLSDWQLDGTGHCLNCGGKVAGFFLGEAGNWGAKRLPVNLAEFR
jgi:pyruvate formate lyase activating enzyme